MRRPKPNLEDFAKALPLDNDLKALRSLYQNWEQEDGRGKKRLWALLGKTFEFGCEIAKNEQTRKNLVALVSENPDVSGSNRWQAERKHPFDLLLVLLLGLKEETKATKSQWLRSLKAAQTKNIACTQEAFLVWIEKIGGVDAALKLGKKARPAKKKISDMARDIPEPENLEDKAIKMPLKLSDDDLPDGFGLVIVKKVSDDGDVIPLATIVNERQVSEAVRTFLAELKRQERENEREVQKQEKEYAQSIRKAARAKYYAIEKSKRPTTEFEEFLEEYKAENPNEDPHAFAPMSNR